MDSRLKETFLLGIQNNAQYAKAQELAVLSDNYHEIVKQNSLKKNGKVNQLKLIEQLLASVSMVLIHDERLCEAISTDRYIGLVYSVREELTTLFQILDNAYTQDDKIRP